MDFPTYRTGNALPTSFATPRYSQGNMQLARDLKGVAGEGATDPIETVARVSGLDRAIVELAASYYAAYSDDIDERSRRRGASGAEEADGNRRARAGL